MRWRQDDDDEGVIAYTPDEPLDVDELLRPGSGIGNKQGHTDSGRPKT